MGKKMWLMGVVLAMGLAASGCGGSSGDGTTNATRDVAKEVEEEFEDIVVPDIDTDATIEETVLYDENDVIITATNIEYSDSCVSLNLKLENNSDEQLTFLANTMGYACNAINGYMIDDGYIDVEVAAGKQANAPMEFSNDMLRIHGITTIAEIQIGIDISSEENGDIYTGALSIKTSKAGDYDFDKDTFIEAVNSGIYGKTYECVVDYVAEEILFEQDDLKVISEVSVTNKDNEQLLLFEVENISEQPLYALISNVYANGFCIESQGWSSDHINAGCKKILYVSLDDQLGDEAIEKLGVTSIGTMRFNLRTEDENYDDLSDGGTVEMSIPGFETSFDTSGEEIFNESGIKVLSKGMVKDSYEDSHDIHWILIVENTTGKNVSINDVSDSLSVNGVMTDYYALTNDIEPDMWTVIDIDMDGDSLAGNGISGVKDVTEAEISMEIEDEEYETIIAPKITQKFQ